MNLFYLEFSPSLAKVLVDFVGVYKHTRISIGLLTLLDYKCLAESYDKDDANSSLVTS